MSDSVKSIFKILIKIPVIIAISYLILNVFAFGISYVRLLSISYSIMQVAMENNYLPENEMNVIKEHINEIAPAGDTGGILQNGKIITTGGNNRKQYGEQVTVGIQADFKWLVPFERRVVGLKDSDIEHARNPAKVEESKDSKGWNTRTIKIEYTVPGLKYYPDLG